MFCPKCGNQNIDANSFCNHCGSQLPPAGTDAVTQILPARPAGSPDERTGPFIQLSETRNPTRITGELLPVTELLSRPTEEPSTSVLTDVFDHGAAGQAEEVPAIAVPDEPLPEPEVELPEPPSPGRDTVAYRVRTPAVAPTALEESQTSTAGAGSETAIVPARVSAPSGAHVVTVDDPTEVSRPASRPPFPWRDAAIGAAAMLGVIALIGLGLFFYFGIGTTEHGTMATPAANTATQNEPPSGMAYISGGEFVMGSDTASLYSKPAHKVTVRPFLMDLTEVTNEDYNKFVQATNRTVPLDWRNGSFPAGKERFPVTGMTWEDADAYAKWAGKRLPTEEEWEFAARGTDGRIYPWGNEWKEGLANAANLRNGMQEVRTASGTSPFGIYDMSGNAWEWTSSDARSYPGGAEVKFTREMINPKILRGGYWGSDRSKAEATYRQPYGATGESGGYANSGFRCVKDAQ